MSSCQITEGNGRVGKTWVKMKMVKAGMEVIEPGRGGRKPGGAFQLSRPAPGNRISNEIHFAEIADRDENGFW
jgi:hypothetical protein